MGINNYKEVLVSKEEINSEFNLATERIHVVTCWIGIVLNLAWFISDYFIMPAFWLNFMIWRICVSVGTIVAILMRSRFSISIYNCLFLLVLGISVQNAYMWSVMDSEHMNQHTFAYLALFIGTGMLVLWEFYFSIALIFATIVSNIFFFKIYQTQMTFGEFMIEGGMLTFTVGIFCMFLIRSRYRLTLSEIKSRLELAKSKEIIQAEHALVTEQKFKIESQKNLLQEINKEVKDSINYAQRIQAALLPSELDFKKIFKESFVFFRPKDIVSGDFYWIKEIRGKIFYATADCTGHGVPGGFMTMLGISFLDEIVKVHGINEPGEILDLLRQKIIDTLKQTGRVGENKDGMDIALCVIDSSTDKLSFAGANNSIYIVTNSSELKEFKADKQPCGFFHVQKPFTQSDIIISEIQAIYTFTDGFADQFGGPKGKKFKYRQLEEIIAENFLLDMHLQKDLLSNKIEQWMKNEFSQVDDMLVIGVKI